MPDPKDILIESEFAIFCKPTAVNFQPHPYTVGLKHVAYAADHHGGSLDEAVLRLIPCAYTDHMGKCLLSYDQHTHEKVCFTYLKRNVSAEEVQVWLEKQLDVGTQTFAGERCDGFAFVETGFRVV